MATLAIQRSGAAPFVEVTPTVLGDKFANDGSILLKVTNGANPTAVTIKSVVCSHGRLGDVTYSTLANKEYLLGPWPKEGFNDADGNVTVTYDQNTATTVAAVRVNN